MPEKTEKEIPRFVKWIDDTGAQKLADELGVGVRVIFAWRSKALGKVGYRPDPDRLGAILRLANGKLTAADVYPPKKPKSLAAR